MYQVLIVEDELMVRLGIKNSVEWQQYDMAVVGEAVNGEAGLTLFLKHRPQVVITDIKMAKRDGYQLIKDIRQIDRSCCILVISCVEDFELVKDLANQQIFGYLVKSTMTIHDINEMLALIRRHLDKEYASAALKNLSMLQTEEEFIKIAASCFIDEAGDYAALSGQYPNLLPADPQSALIFLWEKREQQSYCYIHDLIKNETKALAVFPVSDIGALVLLPSPLASENPLPAHIIRLFKQYLNQDVKLFIRNLTGQRETILQCVRQLWLFCEKSLWKSDQNIVYTNEIDLNKYLRINEDHHFWITKAFEHTENAGKEQYFSDEKVKSIRNSVLKKCVAYIDEHYSEDLTLDKVAGYINLSPNYFSSFFKREMGMSFVQYLNNVRVEAAKNLLSETDMFMYEIALAVGYNELTYFSKIFKSYTAVSPKEWRSRIRRSE